MSSYYKYYPEEAPLIDLLKITNLDREEFVVFVIVWIVIFCMMSKFLKLAVYATISTLFTYWLFFGLGSESLKNIDIKTFFRGLMTTKYH